MSFEILQIYWWVIFSLVGALFGFMLFVQGGQTLLFSFPNNKKKKDLIINILGRKWELGFTTLVLFGGVAFAAFPRFYAVSFGGAYWLWIVILIASVLQAVSYEFRKKSGNVFGSKFFEIFLFINGIVLSIGVGVFVSSLYNGNQFTLNELGTSIWHNNLLGLEAFFSVFNLLLGFSVFFLSRILAIFYIYSHIDNDELNLKKDLFKKYFANLILFLCSFLPWIVWMSLKDGYCVTESEVFVCSNKYFKNLIDMPIVVTLLSVGIILFLLSIIIFIKNKNKLPIWIAGLGSILVYFSLFLNVGLNNTSFYPSSVKPSDSLTLSNSSSSLYTLNSMFYVSFLVPFVLMYIIYVWYKMDSKKITNQEIDSDKNSY
ncbi:cytochrome d ubiquinol oxidase subunit II [Spirobacillus cienkowskii]|uniref:cytochrome d ubiquinol oxidase subunit II n=1 Tax=Spirobacillus cienkowskii TaxID=495820 RepID=UPI0030D07E77